MRKKAKYSSMELPLGSLKNRVHVKTGFDLKQKVEQQSPTREAEVDSFIFQQELSQKLRAKDASESITKIQKSNHE